MNDLMHSSTAEIGEAFDDGKLLKDLVDMLVRGEADPLREPYLLLHATELNGNLVCSNNRRLRCLKEYQAKIAPEEVRARVQVDKVDDDIALFVNHLTTKNGGESVFVRGNPKGGLHRASRHVIQSRQQGQNHQQRSCSRQQPPARHGNREPQDGDGFQNESMHNGEEQKGGEGDDYLDEGFEGLEEEDEGSFDDRYDDDDHSYHENEQDGNSKQQGEQFDPEALPVTG